MPSEEDWNQVLIYGQRVRHITFDEGAENVSLSIFSVIAEYRPRTYVLPRLQHLTWRAETPAGLERCTLFLNPDLESLALEIGTRLSQLSAFLADMSSRTRLLKFAFTSPAALPDNFTELLQPQDSLEDVVLVVPGTLSRNVGRWTSQLPMLRSIQLDLTGKTVEAVGGFFEDVRVPSRPATPVFDEIDSGIFSAHDVDLFGHRKSSIQFNGDPAPRTAFGRVRRMHLTGEAGIVSTFIKRLTGSLHHLELVIEEPPNKDDWKELTSTIGERFGNTLHSLRIVSKAPSKSADLSRSTGSLRRESSYHHHHLSLENLLSMNHLTRLEIDFFDSVIFHKADIAHLALSCPSLEVLKLCPHSHFHSHRRAPHLSLADVAPLVVHCRALHTLAITVSADKGSDELLDSEFPSSTALSNLHVGHSWAKNPLQVGILLSLFAPYLHNLQWYHEKDETGHGDANAGAWQAVAECLPHLQHLRLTERSRIPFSPQDDTSLVLSPTEENGADAPSAMNEDVFIKPRSAEHSVQTAPPALVVHSVQTTPEIPAAVVGPPAAEFDMVVNVPSILVTMDEGVQTEPPLPAVEIAPPVTPVSTMEKGIQVSPPEVQPASVPNGVLNKSQEANKPSSGLAPKPTPKPAVKPARRPVAHYPKPITRVERWRYFLLPSMLPSLPSWIPALPALPSVTSVVTTVLSVVAFSWHVFVAYPLTFPFRILQFFISSLHARRRSPYDDGTIYMKFVPPSRFASRDDMSSTISDESNIVPRVRS